MTDRTGLGVLGQHDVARAHPEGQAHRDRAIERGDPVVALAERPGDPDLGTLVALAADDERDPPGSIEDPHPLVDGAGQRDHPVHRQQVVVGQAEVRPEPTRPGAVFARPVAVIAVSVAAWLVVWSGSAPRSEVDRPTVDRHGRLAEDLGQGRVGMGRIRRSPRRRVEVEGDGRLGDEVGRVRPDEVDAKRVAGLGVADDLAEALVLAADDRLGDGLERDLADLVRRSPAPGTAARSGRSRRSPADSRSPGAA